MSIEGQGHFFTIYFPRFVCLLLYLAKISGERLQDHWSSGLLMLLTTDMNSTKDTEKQVFSGIKLCPTSDSHKMTVPCVPFFDLRY